MCMRSGPLSGWDLTVAGSKGSGQFNKAGVGEIVPQNFTESCALFGHGSGSGLAKADAMSFASSAQDDVAVFLNFGEVVARNGSPSDPSNEGEAGRFVGRDERARVRWGNLCRPAGWM